MSENWCSKLGTKGNVSAAPFCSYLVAISYWITRKKGKNFETSTISVLQYKFSTYIYTKSFLGYILSVLEVLQQKDEPVAWGEFVALPG